VPYAGCVSAEDYLHGFVLHTITFKGVHNVVQIGYVPLGSRKEEVAVDVPPSHLKGISCEEISINSEAKVKLAGIVVRREGHTNEQPRTVIMYLQGAYDCHSRLTKLTNNFVTSRQCGKPSSPTPRVSTAAASPSRPFIPL
jgi:hypothetical protein